MYNIWIIVLPFIIFSLTAQFNGNNRKIAWVAYGVFAVFYAFRGGVGTDWQAYLEYFNQINDPVMVAKSGFESGYLLLCRIFSGLGLSYWVMRFFISLFTVILFYKATEAQTHNTGIALLAGLFYFFYPSLEASRQILALSLFYYSLKYLDEKPFRYFLLNLVGLMFHRTAAIALLFYFFRKRNWIKIGTIAGVFAFTAVKPLLMAALRGFPGIYDKVLWYTNTTGGLSSLFSFKVVESIALLLLFYLFKGKNKKEIMITNLLEMGVLTQVFLPMVLDAAYRFGYYSDIGVILAYCGILDRINKRQYRFIYVILLTAFIALRFWSLISSQPELFGIGGVF